MYRCQTSPFVAHSTPTVMSRPYISSSASIGASCDEGTNESDLEDLATFVPLASFFLLPLPPSSHLLDHDARIFHLPSQCTLAGLRRDDASRLIDRDLRTPFRDHHESSRTSASSSSRVSPCHTLNRRSIDLLGLSESRSRSRRTAMHTRPLCVQLLILFGSN